MGQLATGMRQAYRNPVFAAITERRRRRILDILLDRTSPVAEEDLAIHLAAAEQGKPLLDIVAEDVQSLEIDLAHVQLPALERAGLVVWDEEEATVTTTDHPAFQDPKFVCIVETEADGWDDVLASLTSKRRRITLSVLKGWDVPMVNADLAREIATCETDGEGDPDSETVADLHASLHQVHLPKLDDAGLVEYDTVDGTVAYVGHPALNEEWLDFHARGTPRAILTAAEQSRDIWRIEGRDQVIERGRALCDYADEELFMMFTTEGLVEKACLHRIQDAIDRGVDVYVGSQSPAVRDLVREEAPEVTLWEPQLDWLNLPPGREKVGRLILVDREAIMLGTLGERTEQGVYKETAITGTGENNALVVLMREMLGSRLDHLDAQSEGVRTQIPL
jgi:DNA-binding transcriptional ArsR family regulator